MNVFSLQDRLFYENRIQFGDNIHLTVVNTLELFSLQTLVNENITLMAVQHTNVCTPMFAMPTKYTWNSVVSRLLS